MSLSMNIMASFTRSMARSTISMPESTIAAWANHVFTDLTQVHSATSPMYTMSLIFRPPSAGVLTFLPSKIITAVFPPSRL